MLHTILSRNDVLYKNSLVRLLHPAASHQHDIFTFYFTWVVYRASKGGSRYVLKGYWINSSLPIRPISWILLLLLVNLSASTVANRLTLCALLSCLAFISARRPLPIICSPGYLLPPCGLPLPSEPSHGSSMESGVLSSSERSELLL